MYGFKHEILIFQLVRDKQMLLLRERETQKKKAQLEGKLEYLQRSAKKSTKGPFCNLVWSYTKGGVGNISRVATMAPHWTFSN
jgi:hypothetical protein